MILFTNTKIYGWDAAIRGMRNPMNSWDRSDTEFTEDGRLKSQGIGENDYKLMKKLADVGQVHGKYLRMINVTTDITAPRYWWIEYDTYKVGTVSNSCSTMHKIHSKQFTLEDFSIEHLEDDDPLGFKEYVIKPLNWAREKFLETKDKRYWWFMIQTLPQSYNQRRTVQLNYAVLKNIYEYRKDHKLDCWRDFCKWIERLPYSELITGGKHEMD